MGAFFEHFIGASNVASNLTVECDFDGHNYHSFSIDGKKYSEQNTWNNNDYYLFDHHYNSMILRGYSDDDNQLHTFRATVDLGWENHNRLIDLQEIS